MQPGFGIADPHTECFAQELCAYGDVTTRCCRTARRPQVACQLHPPSLKIRGPRYSCLVANAYTLQHQKTTLLTINRQLDTTLRDRCPYKEVLNKTNDAPLNTGLYSRSPHSQYHNLSLERCRSSFPTWPPGFIKSSETCADVCKISPRSRHATRWDKRKSSLKHHLRHVKDGCGGPPQLSLTSLSRWISESL